jgi:hypothetical protein
LTKKNIKKVFLRIKGQKVRLRGKNRFIVFKGKWGNQAQHNEAFKSKHICKRDKKLFKIISVAPSNTLLISVLNLNDRNEVRSS